MNINGIKEKYWLFIYNMGYIYNIYFLKNVLNKILVFKLKVLLKNINSYLKMI